MAWEGRWEEDKRVKSTWLEKPQVHGTRKGNEARRARSGGLRGKIGKAKESARGASVRARGAEKTEKTEREASGESGDTRGCSRERSIGVHGISDAARD